MNENLDKAGSMSNQAGNGSASERSNPASSEEMSQNRGDKMNRSQTIGKPDMGMSKPKPNERGEDMDAEEPKRRWGQEHSQGSNAPWGTEGSKVGPDLRWGETSHEGDARGTHETSHDGDAQGNEAEPSQPEHALNEDRSAEQDSKREDRPGSDEAQNSESGR